jgi:hypothetical protein
MQPRAWPTLDGNGNHIITWTHPALKSLSIGKAMPSVAAMLGVARSGFDPASAICCA